jgi:hypothetical protein
MTELDTELDLARYQDPLTIQRVLHTAKTIAIVGLSKNELRASYFVGYYLKRHGYRVIPVNPRETEILGETCYPSLLEVPVPVDVVNVFRAPLVPVRRDQRRGRQDRLRRRGDGDHGPLPEGGARALHRPDALARLQHPADHVRPRRPAVVSVGSCLPDTSVVAWRYIVVIS